MLEAWDDFSDKYHVFYWANYLKSRDDIWGKFDETKDAFITLYDDYFVEYMVPMPMFFVRDTQYYAFKDGIEELWTLFDGVTETKDSVALLGDEDRLSATKHLNYMRSKMTEVRIRIDFRGIVTGSAPMYLTEQQANELTNRLVYLRDKTPTTSHEHALDYGMMVLAYINILKNQYVESNAGFNTSGFHGFTPYGKEQAKMEKARIEYLLENGKANMSYSYAPFGLSPVATLGIMNTQYGTTVIDSMHNSFEIIYPALALLAILMVIFSLFMDLRDKTIIGSVASPNFRWKILLAKLVACLVAMMALMFVFGMAVMFIGAIKVGSFAVAPTILFPVFGLAIIELSPVAFLALYLLLLLVKLFLVASVVGLLCMVIKNMYLLAGIGVLFVAALVVIDVFLTPFIVFQFLFWPIVIVGILVASYFTYRLFAKKAL
jgi:hypothetical protein